MSIHSTCVAVRYFRKQLHVGRIRGKGAAILVDIQRLADRRKRTLRAGSAFADFAACANRRCRRRIAEIKSVRVDKPRRMANVTAKRNREGLPGCAIATLSA